MGKGLGSKFAGLFVTSDNDSEVDVEALLQQQINECSEIKTENVVATESIVLNVENLTTADSIYNENDLQCNEKSIFKVKEIESVLPTTLPIEAKKASVIGMMGVSQLTLETVLADADKRISVLAGALAKFTEETVKTINDSLKDIICKPAVPPIQEQFSNTTAILNKQTAKAADYLAYLNKH